MKQLFRCEYCDQIGPEEEIKKHEEECIFNYTKHSCLTCKYAERGMLNYKCTNGKDIPEGKYLEQCNKYEWDEQDHVTRKLINTGPLGGIFGGLF